MYHPMRTIALSESRDAAVIIDQTLLPGEKKYVSLRTPEEFFEAIRKLRVRGAPAIGIAGAFGLYLAARSFAQGAAPDAALGAAQGASGCAQDAAGGDSSLFRRRLAETAAYLNSSRPTAVNLGWALRRMEAAVDAAPDSSVSKWLGILEAEALAIADEDAAMCRAIGEHALPLLSEGMGVLTHCNAGSLATGGIGTATAGLYLAAERGIRLRVYCDETRPLLQGARLTALELSEAGLDTTLLCDGMAAAVMGEGSIQAVFTGADRIAANGDSANKIGTRAVAICARYHDIPFYICAPYSTLDPACPDGAHIPIEERDPAEVTTLWYAQPMAPQGISVRNPAFDVTPAELITGIITEQGIARPPFAQSLAGMHP
ncbi:MAG: S-methyl-5-thioribose-1-phosphate isomerase [Clostridiales Family XIII bacterium]|jgi:methylthioribose-1-phosphate isomerase|nr:S-methyl-5-thioribose-1-phosphate isomerase [Clostridiales Family XIII bacterium]